MARSTKAETVETQETVETIDSEEVTEKPKEPKEQDPMKIMVKITLFKDNDRYKDDLFVAVNGFTYLIKRGIEVEVPLPVAEVIRNSEESDRMTAIKIAETEDKYEAIR